MGAKLAIDRDVLAVPRRRTSTRRVHEPLRRRGGAPEAAPRRWGLRLRGYCGLVLGVRLEDEITDALLRRDVRDRP
jgi:hypothetical protein